MKKTIVLVLYVSITVFHLNPIFGKENREFVKGVISKSLRRASDFHELLSRHKKSALVAAAVGLIASIASAGATVLMLNKAIKVVREKRAISLISENEINDIAEDKLIGVLKKLLGLSLGNFTVLQKVYREKLAKIYILLQQRKGVEVDEKEIKNRFVGSSYAKAISGIFKTEEYLQKLSKLPIH